MAAVGPVSGHKTSIQSLIPNNNTILLGAIQSIKYSNIIFEIIFFELHYCIMLNHILIYKYIKMCTNIYIQYEYRVQYVHNYLCIIYVHYVHNYVHNL